MTLLTSVRSERSTHHGARDTRRPPQPSRLEVVARSKVNASQASADELLDVCTTRKLLEEQAARFAAQNITAKDVEALEKIADSLEVAITAGRTQDIATLQRKLHFTIYRAAKRSHLQRLIEDLWDVSARYTVPASAFVAWQDECHVIRSIVSACRLNDANALGLMIRLKIHKDSERLLASAAGIETEVSESGVSKNGTKRASVSGRR